MPRVTLNGTTIPVQSFGDTEPLRVGQDAEAEDGTARSTVTATLRRFEGTTRPLAGASFRTVYNLVNSLANVTLAGDYLDDTAGTSGGTMACQARVRRVRAMERASSYMVIEFELRQATP